MNIDESKQEFRAQMQEQLQMLDAEDRRGRSLKICNRVFELPVWKRAQVVVVFEPFPYEPEIAPLIADLHRRGSEIIAILPTARSQHDVAIFAPIDVVLVPGIAFTRAGAGVRWSYAPLVFAVVGTTFFALHSARIINTPADALAQIAGVEPRPASVTGIVTTEPKIEATGNASFLLRLHKAKIN